jgi:hypothetical protein
MFDIGILVCWYDVGMLYQEKSANPARETRSREIFLFFGTSQQSSQATKDPRCHKQKKRKGTEKRP